MGGSAPVRFAIIWKARKRRSPPMSTKTPVFDECLQTLTGVFCPLIWMSSASSSIVTGLNQRRGCPSNRSTLLNLTGSGRPSPVFSSSVVTTRRVGPIIESLLLPCWNVLLAGTIPFFNYFLNFGGVLGLHQLYPQLFGSVKTLYIRLKMLFHNSEAFYVAQQLFKEFCMFYQHTEARLNILTFLRM